MKRFTETAKWDDQWFRPLPGHVKLAFLYIIDRCDNAGFWEVDLDGMEFHTKLSRAHCEGALKALERGIKESSGWVWISTFLKHQKNSPLNPENPAHRQIISLVKDQLTRFPECLSLLPEEGASKGLPSPIGKGIGKSNGKGRVKENSELMIRIGGWFGRKPDTLWSEKEAHALKMANPTDAEIEGMECYYGASIPKTEDIRRRDLQTLLNNWSGELDRARTYLNQ